MYKHLNDDGDINVVINTQGHALLVCSKCGNKWFGNYLPNVGTPSPARESFVQALSKNLGLAQSMNIDIEKF